jgi:hypothetical protein
MPINIFKKNTYYTKGVSGRDLYEYNKVKPYNKPNPHSAVVTSASSLKMSLA